MKKNTVKLNEQQLKKIIGESVKKVLKEWDDFKISDDFKLSDDMSFGTDKVTPGDSLPIISQAPRNDNSFNYFSDKQMLQLSIRNQIENKEGLKNSYSLRDLSKDIAKRFKIDPVKSFEMVKKIYKKIGGYHAIDENKIQKIVAENVKNVLKESSVAVRGTQTDTGTDTSNYNSRYFLKQENDSIEKYGEAICQRIDYALQKRGLKSHTQVNEDIDNINTIHDGYQSIRTMNFQIRISTPGIKSLEGGMFVGKMFEAMSMISAYRINIKTFNGMPYTVVEVIARVKPDKNGMKQLQKKPSYQSNSGNNSQSYTTYRSDEV